MAKSHTAAMAEKARRQPPTHGWGIAPYKKSQGVWGTASPKDKRRYRLQQLRADFGAGGEQQRRYVDHILPGEPSIGTADA